MDNKKKYELTTNIKKVYRRTLYQIRALRDFGNVKKGDLGGYIATEENLSHDGGAWIRGDACVSDNACVCGDAQVYDKAWVCGNAKIYGNACVCRDSDIEYTKHYMAFDSFGSRDATTTIYRATTGIRVCCGCFEGTLDEFRDRVKKIHGDNSYAKEYLAIADIAELRFGKKEEV